MIQTPLEVYRIDMKSQIRKHDNVEKFRQKNNAWILKEWKLNVRNLQKRKNSISFICFSQEKK